MSYNFCLLWNSLPFPAFVIDNNHCVAQCNSSAEQFVQTSQGQIIGKPLSRYFGANAVILDTLKQAALQKSSIAQYGVNLTSVTRATLMSFILINLSKYLNY